MAYAKETSVSVSQRISNIRAMLSRFGARSVGMRDDDDLGLHFIEFKFNEVNIRMTFPDPEWESREIQFTESGKKRSELQAEAAFQQALRARWAAAEMILKARLVAVECGFRTFEVEFLPDIVAEHGETAAEHMEKLRLEGKPMLRISA